MKKLLCFILAVTLILSFASCGKKNEEADVVEETKDASLEEYFNNTDKDEGEMNEVIFDENGIKITAVEFEEKGFMGPEISLSIENNTESNVRIQAKDVSVNGFMVGVYFSADVLKGEVATDTLTLNETSLELSGISEIDDVEFTLYAVKPETEEFIFEKDINLDFIKEEFVQSIDNSGVIMIDTGEIKIVGKSLKEVSGEGAQLIVYAENNTDRDLTYTAGNVMVNNLGVNPTFALDIPAGKKAVGVMNFTQEDFDTNAITKVNNLSCEFKAYDFEIGDYYYRSETVSVTFE